MGRIFLVCFLFLSTLATPSFGEERSLKADEVLPYLIGHWRFKFGDTEGGRIYTPVFKGSVIEVEEYFDNLPVQGKGLVQYTASTGTFYSTIFFDVDENDFLTGVFDEESQTISYRSVKPENENLEFFFHIIGPDHFEYNNFLTENGEHALFFHVDFYRVK